MPITSRRLPAFLAPRVPPCLCCRSLPVGTAGPSGALSVVAALVWGQGSEGRPAVFVRGLTWYGPDNDASELVRPAAEDMFR